MTFFQLQHRPWGWCPHGLQRIVAPGSNKVARPWLYKLGQEMYKRGQARILGLIQVGGAYIDGTHPASGK